MYRTYRQIAKVLVAWLTGVRKKFRFLPNLRAVLSVNDLGRKQEGSMDGIVGNLWEYNLCRVIIVDVSDDYRLMQPPLPSDFYPVLREMWLPRHCLSRQLPQEDLVPGYLYDWHERPDSEIGSWYVGVVEAHLTREALG